VTGALPAYVDAAARAALVAIDRGARGVYDIAEPNPHLCTGKAWTEFGWDPAG
jgi:hypothetical protein